MHRLTWALPAAAAAGAIALAASGAADPPSGPHFSPVPSANTKAAGYAPASRLGGGLQQVAWAQGSTKLENPEGSLYGWYGYENDVPSPDDPNVPQMVPASLSSPAEAQKTEPDENTYLTLDNATGPDSSYNYGTHFLFQGHEAGVKDANGIGQSYITRINLDADAAHRVTLMATHDADGHAIATIDGSTWDPFAQRLLFTTENANAPTYAATTDVPSTVEDVSGALGRGGFEGIQNDKNGNIWIVEDIGGSKKKNGSGTDTAAKRPNSFVYRYVPAGRGDLHNGRLQALQVMNAGGDPITFESQAPLNSPDQLALHTYGESFQTKWVTIHNTANDGTSPFNANDAAKAKHATPFKRPENGRFRPGTGFKEFYFDETGDTDATSPENPSAGGWGSIFKLVQSKPSAPTGTLSVFFNGSQETAGIDNTTWLSKDLVTFVEDAGDTLHKQRNALDSGWVFDANTDYSDSSNKPQRWLAEGRDASATLDAANGGFGKNDGDNEITGAVVSDGDATRAGILGAKEPDLFDNGWRWFYTQQHGDNPTYEVIPQPGS